MEKEITIRAEKGMQELFLSREFDYPREMVYRAFADPKMLVKFFGPDRRIMKFDYADFKSGGRYRYTLETGNGNQLCAFHGVIHEMSAPERIIQTSEMEGLPERGHVVMETILFEELPGNRTKVVFQDVCRSVADRDMLVASGMEGGLQEGFARLDKILSEK